MILIRRVAHALLPAFLLVSVATTPGFAAPIALLPGEVPYCTINGPAAVRVYTPGTNSNRTIASGGVLATPIGIAVESETSLLITTIGPGQLVRLNLATGIASVLASGGSLGGNPDGVCVGPDGRIFVSTLSPPQIVEINPATGAQRIATSHGDLSSPIFMVATSPTTLAVSSNNTRIVEVNVDTGAQRVITSGGNFVTPAGVVELPGGDLVVADYETGRLVRVNHVNGLQSVLVSGIPAAWGLALDGRGSIYVSRYVSSPGLARYSMLEETITPLPLEGGVPFGIQVYMPSDDPLPPAPGPITNLAATDDLPWGVRLTWTPSPNTQLQRVLRNNSVVAHLSPTDSTYDDMPPVGTYEYCIEATSIGGSSPAVCESGTRRPYRTEPLIAYVADVPADEGGHVSIAWDASEVDNPQTRGTTGYRVWRRLPPFAGAKGGPSGSIAATDIHSRANADGVVEYWEPILTIPAGFRPGYGAVVPTTRDSLPDDNPYTAFFVSALTTDPFVFYDSEVDSGYSVDNLAPPAPPALAGAYLPAGGVRLSWREARADDRAFYEVWRGNARGLDPDKDVLIGSPPDTFFTDPTGGAHFYKVRAVDVHGNRGAAATLSPLEIPTPAWVLEADGSSAGGKNTITVRFVRDLGATDATILRSTTPDLLGASVIAEGVTPVSTGTFVFEDTDPPVGTAAWYWVRANGSQGRVALAGPVVIEGTVATSATLALAPTPNPTAGSATLAFVIGTEAGSGAVPVRARVIDATGRLVREIDRGTLPPGRHELLWDGANGTGARVGAGVYRIRLVIGARAFTQPIVVRR